MRQYRGLTKEDGKWVYGWYSESWAASSGYRSVGSHIRWLDEDSNFQEVEVLLETVGQFTGLCDKNGKDLDWWEDDVLKFEFDYGFVGNLQSKEVIGKIAYKDGQYLLESKDKDYELSFVIGNWHEKIGNIHESPELMEKAK